MALAGQPIVAGWAYQWIAQLSFARDSWTAPVDVRHLHPLDNHNQIAVAQIRALLDRLPTSRQVPLFVFDAGYDPTGLALGLAEAPAAILVRLRSGRCFYADPPPTVATGKAAGPAAMAPSWTPATPPPGRHQPSATSKTRTSAARCRYKPGRAASQAAAARHPRDQTARPIVRGTLVRLQVERMPANTRPPQVLWLWWHGPGTPDLAMLWRAYAHRFDLEHTIRFCKQALGWATPRPRHPRAGRPVDLAGAGWLHSTAPGPLRGHRPAAAVGTAPPARLTLGRVRRGFPQLPSQLGSPADAPKLCGRSPGRPRGSHRGPAIRHPTVKKAA